MPELVFTWAVTGGRLSGKGKSVTWELNGLGEGSYTATVEVNDANQHAALTSTTVTVSLCGSCDPPPPLCPRVSVSCPSEVGSQREIVFEANIAGGEPDLKPTYNWSVSAGKIVGGWGTSKITIDMSEVPRGQGITASVLVGGLHPACPGNASCTKSHWEALASKSHCGKRRVSLVAANDPTLPRYGTDLFQATILI